MGVQFTKTRRMCQCAGRKRVRLEVAVNCGRRADGLRPQRLPHIKRALNFPALDPAALRSQPQAVFVKGIIPRPKAKISLRRTPCFLTNVSPMSAEAQLTPMMAQYRRIKSELPKDALLLFRLGDFYEMFFEDAQTGSQLLNLSLTARNGVPMCGLPFHAANNYIARILKAGRKVAICDQMEDARPGQLVKREVTQILSPGTHFDERLLAAERNNFLAAVFAANKKFGLALVDLTTGDFKTTGFKGEPAMLTELERLRPAEIIYPTEATWLQELLRNANPILPSYDDWVFAPKCCASNVPANFTLHRMNGRLNQLL